MRHHNTDESAIGKIMAFFVRFSMFLVTLPLQGWGLGVLVDTAAPGTWENVTSGQAILFAWLFAVLCRPYIALLAAIDRDKLEKRGYATTHWEACAVMCFGYVVYPLVCGLTALLYSFLFKVAGLYG